MNGNGCHPLGRLISEMDRAFPAFFTEEDATWRPALDVSEDEKSWLVELDVPGFAREQIDVSAEGDLLTIRGARAVEAEPARRWHRRERAASTFEHSVRLPREADAAGVEAKLEHGVLVLRIPKAETAKVRRIELK